MLMVEFGGGLQSPPQATRQRHTVYTAATAPMSRACRRRPTPLCTVLFLTKPAQRLRLCPLHPTIGCRCQTAAACLAHPLHLLFSDSVATDVVAAAIPPSSDLAAVAMTEWIQGVSLDFAGCNTVTLQKDIVLPVPLFEHELEACIRNATASGGVKWWIRKRHVPHGTARTSSFHVSTLFVCPHSRTNYDKRAIDHSRASKYTSCEDCGACARFRGVQAQGNTMAIVVKAKYAPDFDFMEALKRRFGLLSKAHSSILTASTCVFIFNDRATATRITGELDGYKLGEVEISAEVQPQYTWVAWKFINRHSHVQSSKRIAHARVIVAVPESASLLVQSETPVCISLQAEVVPDAARETQVIADAFLSGYYVVECGLGGDCLYHVLGFLCACALPDVAIPTVLQSSLGQVHKLCRQLVIGHLRQHAHTMHLDPILFNYEHRHKGRGDFTVAGFIELTENCNVEDYCNEHSKLSKFAGIPEIAAWANLSGRNTVVLTARNTEAHVYTPTGSFQSGWEAAAAAAKRNAWVIQHQTQHFCALISRCRVKHNSPEPLSLTEYWAHYQSRSITQRRQPLNWPIISLKETK